MKNKRTHVLERAIALVDGDRNKTYGDPTENHTRIAARWSITLGVHVEPWQVPLMMADLKIDRYANCPGHEDSAVDGAAYLAIAHEVWQKEHLPEMGAGHADAHRDMRAPSHSPENIYRTSSGKMYVKTFPENFADVDSPASVYSAEVAED